jgi:hypothetical protein
MERAGIYPAHGLVKFGAVDRAAGREVVSVW